MHQHKSFKNGVKKGRMLNIVQNSFKYPLNRRVRKVITLEIPNSHNHTPENYKRIEIGHGKDDDRNDTSIQP